MRNFVFLLSLLGTPMTVGINTEAINHKNIPFTMYDLGWVVLCIGAAIGSGIVFPITGWIKGVWVFAWPLSGLSGSLLHAEAVHRNDGAQR